MSNGTFRNYLSILKKHREICQSKFKEVKSVWTDELLQQAKLKVEGLRAAIRSTARELIPKMYQALKEENPRITPEDARDRIERDCKCIWSNRTILDALPDEAKNPEKQIARRLIKTKAGSILLHFSAAGLGYNASQKIRKGRPWLNLQDQRM